METDDAPSVPQPIRELVAVSMNIPCHIVVEGNPAIIYSSRNGTPAKMLPILERFLEKFWQEREASGENVDTPGCLAAQLVVRFGFESCEDDYSNLRIGPNFAADVQFLYRVGLDQSLTVWQPDSAYGADPSVGLAGCRPLETAIS